jgi:hypothetical protein
MGGTMARERADVAMSERHVRLAMKAHVVERFLRHLSLG